MHVTAIMKVTQTTTRIINNVVIRIVCVMLFTCNKKPIIRLCYEVCVYCDVSEMVVYVNMLAINEHNVMPQTSYVLLLLLA